MRPGPADHFNSRYSSRASKRPSTFCTLIECWASQEAYSLVKTCTEAVAPPSDRKTDRTDRDRNVYSRDRSESSKLPPHRTVATKGVLAGATKLNGSAVINPIALATFASNEKPETHKVIMAAYIPTLTAATTPNRIVFAARSRKEMPCLGRTLTPGVKDVNAVLQATGRHCINWEGKRESKFSSLPGPSRHDLTIGHTKQIAIHFDS